MSKAPHPFRGRRRRSHPQRVVGIAALAALALGALVACGDDESASPPQSAPSTSTSAPEPTESSAAVDAYPVTVTHAFGETVIPSEPSRVVTIGFNESDFALALGVQPVGVREYLGGFDFENRVWATDLMGEEPPPTVGGNELNLEAIAALRPDLILGTYAFLEAPQYEALSQIAPTVGDLVDPGNESGTAASWQRQLEAIGQALGRSEQAAELQAEVEADFSEVRAAHPEWASQELAVNLGGLDGGGYFVLEPGDPRMRFFTELGFAAPETDGEVSAEQADLLDVDVLVNAGTSREDALAQPLFANLDVVQQDRTLFFGGYDGEFLGALGYASPLSLPYAIDLAVPDLAAAADGDPATKVTALR